MSSSSSPVSVDFEVDASVYQINDIGMCVKTHGCEQRPIRNVPDGHSCRRWLIRIANERDAATFGRTSRVFIVTNTCECDRHRYRPGLEKRPKQTAPA